MRDTAPLDRCRASTAGTPRDPQQALRSPERAVLFASSDDGETWTELPLRISVAQLWLPRAWLNWPPDEIDVIADEHGTLVIYFEDGWITWERGCKWKATYQPSTRWWHVTKLECG
jgi:hypothetical protein